jgi:hypothetical protein
MYLCNCDQMRNACHSVLVALVPQDAANVKAAQVALPLQDLGDIGCQELLVVGAPEAVQQLGRLNGAKCMLVDDSQLLCNLALGAQHEECCRIRDLDRNIDIQRRCDERQLNVANTLLQLSASSHVAHHHRVVRRCIGR